jgi:hypothetical protein
MCPQYIRKKRFGRPSPSDETNKKRVPVSQQVWHKKRSHPAQTPGVPSRLRPKFCSPSPAMMESPYK